MSFTQWDGCLLVCSAEQYAMDTGHDPAEFTAENISQLQTPNQCAWASTTGTVKSIRQIRTTTSGRNGFSPSFYEKGLAYEAEVPVNWVEELGTAIANEEVLPDGTSERAIQLFANQCANGCLKSRPMQSAC